MARQEPIRSLDELAAWRPATASRLPSPLAPREPLPAESPRVLVCHDMQGGYLDDAYLHGNGNSDAFRLFHWHLIDSFVYFSHHLVTVPPPGWVDLCHRHGVACLGTFITEWDAGQDAMRRLLTDEDAAAGWADRLLEVAEACAFDGWLINVEVALEPELVPALKAFLRRLRAKTSLTTVWYDSVTEDGRLRWQNCVNSQNEAFLLAAGAILLNYCWTGDLLRASASRVARLQAGADGPLTVYVGVDCFGRGCPGGGGFNCSEALRQIADCSLGVGLFAPGWAYETCPDTQAGEIGGCGGGASWEMLVERTLEFWAAMTPLLGPPRPWTGRLNTAFCLGQGSCKWDRGRLVSNSAWNSLWEAHPLPHYWLCGSDQHLSLCRSRAWQGGGCLRVGLGGCSGGGCELPLFRLSLPAGRVRALKLVYSLDSVFEDRPLDPVTVCLVAKYRCRDSRRQLVVLCHSSESRLSCSEMATVQSHYGSDASADCQTLVFPRTVRRENEGDSSEVSGGIVWHTVYTEAGDPRAAVAADSDLGSDDCRLEQLSLFFILPSRLESPDPVCVYLGQVKVALRRPSEKPLAS